MFNRQAFVGLTSDQYGTVTLGRQYDSVVDYLAPLSLTRHAATAVSVRATRSTTTTWTTRSRQQLGQVHERELRAASSSAACTASRTKPASFANNRAWSVGASYNYGPLNVAAAYLQLNNSAQPCNANGAVSARSSGTAPIGGWPQRTFGAGVNYAYRPGDGRLRVHAYATATTCSASTSAARRCRHRLARNLHLDNYEVERPLRADAGTEPRGSYTYTDGKVSGSNGSGDPKWHTVSLQADYSLSKRTDVYVEGVYQHASGELGNAGANVATINTLPPSSTENQVAAAVGLRHRF